MNRRCQPLLLLHRPHALRLPRASAVGAMLLLLAPMGCGGESRSAASPDASSVTDAGGGRVDAATLDRQRGIDVVVDVVVDAGAVDRAAAESADVAVVDTAVRDSEASLDAGGCYPARFAPPELTRGLRWVRVNPMFISSLAVSVGDPPPEFVHAYYDDFNASATHLWADGLPEEITAWASAGREDFRYVAWLDGDGNSAANGQLLGGMSPDTDHRIGYQIGDEPGQTCGDSSYACALGQMEQMSHGVDSVRALDPDALVFLNFNNHRELEALLEAYGTSVDGDLFSYDRYNRGWGEYETIEIVRRAALEHGKPYWRYLEAFYDQSEPPAALTESDLRWSAFMGLLYGFTGHTWFIYSCGPNDDIDPALLASEADFDAPPTDLWRSAAQVNSELRNLGRVITQLTSTDVRYLPAVALALPTNTRRWEPGAGADPFLTDVTVQDGSFVDVSLGFFRDDAGEHYLMVQNVSHEGGEIPTNLGGTGIIRLTFAFGCAGGAVSDTELLSVRRTTGEVETLPLTAAGAERILDLVLEPGNVVLLKYDSGRPFAGLQG